MKNKIIAVAFVLSFIASTSKLKAQLLLPPPSSTQTIIQGLGIEKVYLNYGRPKINGRSIFGELVPYGKIWRTGANACTTITFEGDMLLNGHKVESGTYALFTIPDKDEWTIILNKNAKQWGAYNYSSTDDVLRFKVKPEPLDRSIETFTISFDDISQDSAKMNIVWEKTAVTINLKAQQQGKILNSIETALKGVDKPYFAAGQYYYNNGLDIEKTLFLFNEAEKAEPEALHILIWKAKAEIKAGKTEDAFKTAQKGLNLATQSNNSEYIKLNQQVLDSLKK